MKRWTLFTLGLFATLSVFAQTANELLSQIQKNYEAYNSIDLQLDLEIKYSDGTLEVSEARLVQQGEQYFFNSDQQAIYNDGESLWVHLKEIEEVQWNNHDPDEDQISSMSPKSLLALVSDQQQFEAVQLKGGFVEIKPLDDTADYSKIRMSINDNESLLQTIWIFGKDGSRIVLDILDMKVDVTHPEKLFVFDKADHPNIHLEDLRID